MKRPISLLCIADVHYDKNGDMSVVNSLRTELAKYIDEKKERIKWSPDYIVVAGDVADKNGGYTEVAALIERLRARDTFNIAPDHVIVVPGNHDIESAKSVSEMKDEKQVFDEFSKKCNKTNISKFGKLFEKKFNKFIEFSRPYTHELKYNTEGDRCVLDPSLRQLSGVKVIPEDHLCFLYVNTEWLYMSCRSGAKVMNESDEECTEFIRLDENCQLCAPLIKDACDLINKDYKDYTVVTVMHRGFEHLSWSQKNISDAQSINAIEYLLRTSDIIITGHDHVFTPVSPTLIRNRVQHFQLGAVGIKESMTMEHARSAEILRLNIPDESVEQLIIYCDKNQNGLQWNFVESKSKLPLFSKYLSSGELSSGNTRFRDTLLRSLGSSPDDIERAISTYFQCPPSFGLHIVPAQNDIDQRLDNLVLRNMRESMFIVIYYPYFEYVNGMHSKNSKTLEVKQKIDSFRDRNIKAVMSCQIIVNEVVVDYPLE